MNLIANELGERFRAPVNYTHEYLDKYLRADFLRTLVALEAVHKLGHPYFRKQVDDFVLGVIQQSECSLGVHWDDGQFLRTGARLLDDRLVNDPLHWLRADAALAGVLQPFERGLSNLPLAERNPNLLPGIVNDMQESLEALAHIVTDRLNKDLSANSELFLSKIKAPPEYKPIMKEYLNYANELARHAREGAAKRKLTMPEVESFVYLTGLFLGMAIQTSRDGERSNRS